MAGGALEGRDSRRPIQRRVGEGPRREAGNWRGEAGESRRSGRAGACRARLPFWSRAAATAAGFGRKREEPQRGIAEHSRKKLYSPCIRLLKQSLGTGTKELALKERLAETGLTELQERLAETGLTQLQKERLAETGLTQLQKESGSQDAAESLREQGPWWLPSSPKILKDDKRDIQPQVSMVLRGVKSKL
ncbi:uncharacterized protein LOC128115610 isoform X2 [Peromyscus californicus insignis]|uniref:uncharacterized protein LOC128115610 isoform X2 n=1 Tax=Peromyscus californicus insignis TaxID=564181 RepID=UPI0022A67D2E|nr:uncharacterized protein LOC128115610 isoform X2 [Peromyscus californicus insignis]